MPRTRQIRPGFFTNDTLGELRPVVRLLFAGLWTVADREGRLLDRPKKLKAELLAYDKIDVDKALDQLASAGFIQRYASGKTRYLSVNNWRRHQHPHPREEESVLPAPESNGFHLNEGIPELTIGDDLRDDPGDDPGAPPARLVASSSFPSSTLTSLREENPPTPLGKGGRVRRRRNGQTASGAEDAVPVCRCAELRADLAVNRNCYPFCELHGDVRKVPVS